MKYVFSISSFSWSLFIWDAVKSVALPETTKRGSSGSVKSFSSSLVFGYHILLKAWAAPAEPVGSILCVLLFKAKAICSKSVVETASATINFLPFEIKSFNFVRIGPAPFITISRVIESTVLANSCGNWFFNRLTMFDSTIGQDGSRDTSVLWSGIPFTSWKLPTVVLPSLGNAGNIIAASKPKTSINVRVSTAMLPLKTESIFL